MPTKRLARHAKSMKLHPETSGGLSFKEIGNKILDYGNTAYTAIKKYKPATKILDIAPSAANIPYAGAALKFVKAIGGKKRRNKHK